MSSVERSRERFIHHRSVEEKKMFGGINFVLNGNILVCVWKDLLIVRLGDKASVEALTESHVKGFDITPITNRGWLK